MKASVKALALAMLVALVAVGCSKVEKILPKKDGMWKQTSAKYDWYNNSTLDSSWTETAGDSADVWEFLKDGVGNIISTDTTMAFTWSVNDDNDAVTICQSFSGLSFCVTMDVLESEKNKQVWFYSDKETGDSTWTETTSTMERVN
ncbi:MAG: hypothetical protein U0176_21395 [Bacteroidia bacterium]